MRSLPLRESTDCSDVFITELRDSKRSSAEDLLESLNSVMNTSLQSVDSLNGKDLIGLSVNHPFYNFDVPIIFADHVTTESGSGIVHIAIWTIPLPDSVVT